MSSIQAVLNETSDIVLKGVTAAGIGYCLARAFMSISPIHAAAVTGFSVLIHKVTQPVFDKLFAGPHSNQASRILGSILNITLSVAASASLANLIGVPVTVPVFVCLSAFTVGSFVLVALGIVIAKSIAACYEKSYEDYKKEAAILKKEQHLLTEKFEAEKQAFSDKISGDKHLIAQKLHLTH